MVFDRHQHIERRFGRNAHGVHFARHRLASVLAFVASICAIPSYADSSCGPFAPLAASAVLAVTAANSSDSFYLADLARIERGQSREVIADINARLKRGTVAGDVYTAAVLAAALSAEGLDTEARVVAEKAIADANRTMDKNIETIFLTGEPKYTSVASTIVRDIIRNGGDASPFLPDQVNHSLQHKSL